jgi:hypothetical protein
MQSWIISQGIKGKRSLNSLHPPRPSQSKGMTSRTGWLILVLSGCRRITVRIRWSLPGHTSSILLFFHICLGSPNSTGSFPHNLCRTVCVRVQSEVLWHFVWAALSPNFTGRSLDNLCGSARVIWHQEFPPAPPPSCMYHNEFPMYSVLRKVLVCFSSRKGCPKLDQLRGVILSTGTGAFICCPYIMHIRHASFSRVPP